MGEAARSGLHVLPCLARSPSSKHHLLRASLLSCWAGLSNCEEHEAEGCFPEGDKEKGRETGIQRKLQQGKRGDHDIAGFNLPNPLQPRKRNISQAGVGNRLSWASMKGLC